MALVELLEPPLVVDLHSPLELILVRGDAGGGGRGARRGGRSRGAHRARGRRARARSTTGSIERGTPPWSTRSSTPALPALCARHLPGLQALLSRRLTCGLRMCPRADLLGYSRGVSRTGSPARSTRQRAARRLRHGRLLRRDVQAGRRPRAAPRPHYARLAAPARGHGRARAAPRGRAREPLVPAPRRHLHRLLRRRARGRSASCPFDPIPRLIPADEWALVEAGLKQRIRALNRFVHDVYHEQEILRDGIVPRRLVVLARALPARGRRHRRAARPVHPRRRAATSSAARDGRWMVLEDNLRVPERRLLRARQPRDHDPHASPTGSTTSACARSTHYAGQLLENLRALSPRPRRAAAAGRRSSC